MDSRWTRLWRAAQRSCSGPGIEGSWQRLGWPRRSGPAPGALSTEGTGLGWSPTPPPPLVHNTSPLPKWGSFPFLDPWDAVSVWVHLWGSIAQAGLVGVRGQRTGVSMQIPRGEMAVLARHSLVRPVGKQRSCWLRLRKPGSGERNGCSERLGSGSRWCRVRVGAPVGDRPGVKNAGVGAEAGSGLRALIQTQVGLWSRTGVCIVAGVGFWAGAHPCPRWGCGTE